MWTFAKVSFNAPLRNDGSINKYKVTAILVGTEEKWTCEVSNRGSCGTSCILLNLKASAEYQVSVQACFAGENKKNECGLKSDTVTFTSASKFIQLNVSLKVIFNAIILLVNLYFPMVLLILPLRFNTFRLAATSGTHGFDLHSPCCLDPTCYYNVSNWSETLLEECKQVQHKVLKCFFQLNRS